MTAPRTTPLIGSGEPVRTVAVGPLLNDGAFWPHRPVKLSQAKSPLALAGITTTSGRTSRPGANVLSLTALMPRWGAVIASGTAHIHTDEGGAPERVSGLKLFTVPTPDGKLTPELVATEAFGWGDEHRSYRLSASSKADQGYAQAFDDRRLQALDWRADLQPNGDDEIGRAHV